MQVLIDVSTPKETVFFKPIIEELSKRGCQVKVITRKYSELNLLLEHFNIQAKIIGRHGGETLYGKLDASAERLRLVAGYMDTIKPDVVVNYVNPESTRAAFGLGIPVICFDDLPEAEAVTRLNASLATWIMTPWIIPKTEFTRYGIASDRVYHYHALDPVIWLKDYKIDVSYLRKLNLDSNRPVAVYREAETRAAYLLGKEDMISKIVATLDHRHPKPHKWQFIHIPRYQNHRIYDLPSLLALAHVFIGGGGTMCLEAAYYGTPVVATRPLRCYYMDWLFEQGLAKKVSTLDEAIQEADTIINTKKRNTEKAKQLFGDMKFPLAEVCDIIVEEAK